MERAFEKQVERERNMPLLCSSISGEIPFFLKKKKVFSFGASSEMPGKSIRRKKGKGSSFHFLLSLENQGGSVDQLATEKLPFLKVSHI